MSAPAWLGPALTEAGKLVVAMVKAGVSDIPRELREIAKSYEHRTDAAIENAWAEAKADRLAEAPVPPPRDTEPTRPGHHDTQPSMPAVTDDDEPDDPYADVEEE